MSAEHASEEKQGKVKRQEPVAGREEAKEKARPTHEGGEPAATVSALQNLVGNRAVQRLLAQRSGEAPFELDQDTEARINNQRGGGQSLDDGVRNNLESSLGYDFGSVRVHTSPEADDLNQQLGAKAFTTGNDIFFRQGQYDPHSSGGQELIAHEATHVVQQNTGVVSSGSGMTVNAPGDVYEQEADQVASQVTSASSPASVQRDPLAEEEEAVQMQTEEEEEEVQAQEMPEEEEELQMQEMPEEEEELQMQELPEEEEELQMQEMPEEEELQAKRDR
jgi:hypothetical protein